MNLYSKGEEKFGPVTSRLYLLIQYLPITKKFYNFIVSDLLRYKWDKILDVGTGPGILLDILAKRAIDKSIFAVDPSKYMVKLAIKKNINNKNVKIALGSSRAIPFKTKFNIIFSSLSFHHWADRVSSIRYLSSKLERNGQIFIYEFVRNGSFLSKLIGSHTLDINYIDKLSKSLELNINYRVYGDVIKLCISK